MQEIIKIIPNLGFKFKLSPTLSLDWNSTQFTSLSENSSSKSYIQNVPNSALGLLYAKTKLFRSRMNKEVKISSKLLIQPTLQRDNVSSLKDAIPAWKQQQMPYKA